MRIAVVTYAASSVRPSPLVTKQFFAEPHVLRDLQLEPYKLGIGQHPAASHGLAALEGFVAAIEVRRPSSPLSLLVLLLLLITGGGGLGSCSTS